MVLPFSLTDGLYLANLYTLSLDDVSPCDDFTFDTTVLVAQTRSAALILPDVVVLPIPIDSSTSLLQASSIVSPAPVFTIPEPSVSFPSRLTMYNSTTTRLLSVQMPSVDSVPKSSNRSATSRNQRKALSGSGIC